MLKNIDPKEVMDILKDLPVSSGIEKIEEIDLSKAVGRVLAEDIYSTVAIPPFDKSPFDGFVFNSEDVPGRLMVEGEVRTGTDRVVPLKRGCAQRIFTGAPLPTGGDVIVKFEDVEHTDTYVEIQKSFKSGFNVIPKGEECEPGQLQVQKSTRLTPAHLGIIASQGIDRIKVYKRPRITLFSTGTELVPPGEKLPDYHIYNSSTYTLAGYLSQMGMDVTFGGILPDDASLIADTIDSAMHSDADLVMTTGGASVGDYDFALDTAEKIGADILFWKVNMKPGGALMVSVIPNLGHKAYVALSGNPAAAIMSIITVLQPYLKRLSGMEFKHSMIRLPITRGTKKPSHILRVLRGRMVVEDGRARFEENQGQRNGNFSSYARCSHLALLPPSEKLYEAGDIVDVIDISDL